MPSTDSLQSLCERGQFELIATDYLAAERTLVEAEAIALNRNDLDALSRLYMPLQEARRQRRQHCGEGTIHLSLLARGPDDPALDPSALIDQFPHGQFLIAGWGSISPAIEFRKLANDRSLYVETFLAAVCSVNGQRAVAIFPSDETLLPPPLDHPNDFSIDALLKLLPPHTVIVPANQLPPGPRAGTDETYADTQELWARLHRPFLSFAELQPDSRARIESFRQVLRVDYACELAHQHLAQTAHRLARIR